MTREELREELEYCNCDEYEIEEVLAELEQELGE